MIGIIILVYADLDTAEEIIKANYLVMRVEKKKLFPKVCHKI